MVDLTKLGNALGGFSAGVAGQLPQFQAGLQRQSLLEQQQEKTLSDERRKEQLLFNRITSDQIANGEIDRAITGTNNRLIELGNRGANTDYTTGINGLLQSGTPQGIAEALRITQAADREAVLRGELEAIEAPKPIARSNISESGMVSVPDGKGGFKEVEVQGFVPDVVDNVNSQISGTKQVKDSKGNLFNSATVFDPATGATKSVMTPLGDSPDQPIGRVQLVDASGLTPEEQINQAGLEAGTAAAATAAISASKTAFDQLSGIDTEIATLDEAVALLDEGADTGPILARLPTFRANAINLENIQSRLGLNVIQNTTFGSLSEAELAFALNTAMPTNLQPEELRSWITRKQDAQRKLSGHIKEAATFLGTPGNTIPKWLDFQKQRGILEAANPSSSSVIRFDSQGNIIQ